MKQRNREANRGIYDFVEQIRWRITQASERRFDNKYSVETAAAESDYLLKLESPNVAFAIPYEAIQLDVFVRMMRDLKKTVEDLADFTFIDLGSGKGRAVLYSALCGFRRCIGVEFSAQLHELAKGNVKTFLQTAKNCSPIELYCMDACQFPLPDENTVIFLYNPFIGDVMHSIVSKIGAFAESSKSDLVVLYRNPVCGVLFDTEFLQKLCSTHSYDIYRIAR